MSKQGVTTGNKSNFGTGTYDVKFVDNLGRLKLLNPGTNMCFVNSVVQLVKPIFSPFLQSRLTSFFDKKNKKVCCALNDFYTSTSNETV